MSGGHVPVGAVLTHKWVFDKVFNSMVRAVVHGSTFSKNDLAMAAGLATLEVIESERLVERSAQLGERLLRSFEEMSRRHELIRSVRGKGLMVGVEFGPPRSPRLRASWNLLGAAVRDREFSAALEIQETFVGAGDPFGIGPIRRSS